MMKSPLTYSEMLRYSSFDDRFEYLALHGRVSELTFGSNRYLNQTLYKMKEWRDLRHVIIERDDGCDLAVKGREIFGPITIHHIMPITVEMVLERHPLVLSPDNLVCVTDKTHRAIHYGTLRSTFEDYKPRSVNDTCPWKKGT